MKEVEKIKDALAAFSSRFGPKAILEATVLGVNEDDTIRVALSSDLEIDDVRLKSVVKEGNKFLLIPVEGSTVLIGRIENSDEFAVVAVDEISDVKAVIGGASLEMNADGFLFSRDGDTLKEVIELIIEAVQKTIVLKGRNPDRGKLAQALSKLNNVLR